MKCLLYNFSFFGIDGGCSCHTLPQPHKSLSVRICGRRMHNLLAVACAAVAAVVWGGVAGAAAPPVVGQMFCQSFTATKCCCSVWLMRHSNRTATWKWTCHKVPFDLCCCRVVVAANAAADWFAIKNGVICNKFNFSFSCFCFYSIGLCGFDNPMRDQKTDELKRLIGQVSYSKYMIRNM